MDEVDIWRLEKTFGKTGPGKLTNGRGVAILPNGDFALANCEYDEYDAQKLKIYSRNGYFKSSFYVPGYPWDIVAKDGRLYINNCTHQISVYDLEGNLLHQFATNPPEPEAKPEVHVAPPDNTIFNSVWRFLSSVWYGQGRHQNAAVDETTKETKERLPGCLYSLAIDNQDNLLIGDYSYEYVHKHRLDGSHISSFKINIFPYFISVARNGKIIICDFNIRTGVNIFDSNGVYLQTLDPPDDFKWTPAGTCCTSDDKLYIGSLRSRSPAAILCYSLDTGAFIRLVTRNVINPYCLTLIDDEQRLVVTDQEEPVPGHSSQRSSQVKIFKRQK